MQRSSQGFFVKAGARDGFQIILVNENKQPQVVKGMGQAIQHIVWDDESYPACVSPSINAPDVLSYLGDVSLLNAPSLAIIGMKQPTPLGRSIAYRVAAFFAQAYGEIQKR